MVTITVANPTKKLYLQQSNTCPALCISVTQRLFRKHGTLLQAADYDPVMFMGKAKEPTAHSGSGYLGSFKNQQGKWFHSIRLSHMDLLTPSIIFSRSWLPFPIGRSQLVQECWSQSHVGSLCAAACGYWPQALQTKVPEHPLAVVSTHAP